MNSQDHRSGVDMADWLFTTVRNNPEGLLLMAAGAALLVRSTHHGGRSRAGSGERAVQTERWAGTERVSRAVDDARQYAAEVGTRASDTASAHTASASRYAREAADSLAGHSEELYERAAAGVQDTFQQVLRERPLLVAFAGLAAGAALAAAFPKTAVERQTLGPYGERMAEFAGEKAQQLKNAGMAAGERLRSEAEKRGLSPDGVKEMTQEATHAFGSAMAGKEGAAGQQRSADPHKRTDEMERLE